MNLMTLVPSNAEDFRSSQRLERLGHCARLRAYEASIQQTITSVQADTTKTDAEKTKWVHYLHAIQRKVQQHHADAHLCWPFSRN